MYSGPPPPFVPSGGAPPYGGAPAYGGSAHYGGAPQYGGTGPQYGGAASSSASQGDDSKLSKSVKDPLLAAIKWVKTRSPKEKTYLGVAAGILLLFILWRTIKDHDTLFVMAEMAHFAGIGFLAYKVFNKRSVAGLSLQTQILTALFLAVRLYCSFMMEYDIHTLLDLLTLVATGFVLFAMLGMERVKQTYQPEMDVVKFWMVLVPCALLAFIAHPTTTHNVVFRVLWALCVYLEAVSVLPQLRMMQKAHLVERFTAHYVFALGLSRFFSCAHWILQLLEGNRYLYQALGSGLWPIMVLLSEVVQTFILADFCFYYIKSYASGTGIVRLPMGPMGLV